ncbi:WIZ protein, partial [Cercotrichas coryphoeus]|nr:WIZ protein [Cercotrichas coryphoeus]
WISRSPSPAFQELPPAPDAAASSAFRRESLPAAAKPSERRRAPPAFAEPAFAEWPLPKLDAAVGKQSWTVNAEDSVERLLPEPAPVAVAAPPYVCGVLLEEPAKAEALEEPDDGAGVFTCIECSIYFRRREHLLEHTLQHNRGAQRGADAAGLCRFCCAECGWAFGEPAALERHRRQHQESREKILEEIQKLDELPDEGREARLQCPKCVFGTNSSKVFVQHAKMHVKERKEHGARSSAAPDGAGRGLYRALPAEELPAGNAPSACALCGFPAPSQHILTEHLRFAHSQLSWQPDAFRGEPSQPGTSRDSYSPARPAAELFGKAERLLPPPPAPRESSSLHGDAFGSAQPRPDRSDGAARKELQYARKAAPYSQPNLGFAGFSSPKPPPPSALLRRRAA